MIVLEIVHAVRDNDPLGQTREVMIERRDRLLGIERAWSVEIADQLFFLVSMLRIGLP